MPKLVSEISSGTSFQFSSSQGQVNASLTRVFRVLLSAPGAGVDVQADCGVRIGDPHPISPSLYCRSYAAQYEGDSRMAVLCTFTYEATAGSQEDPGSKQPDVRPANWSTSTSLEEVPAYSWAPIDQFGDPVMANGAVAWEQAVNKAGDRLDGVTRLAPIVTISVEQWESQDPTKHTLDAGSVNKNVFWIGSLRCFRRSVMFRGVNARPAVESWGGDIYRGWMCTYEFAFRKNWVQGMWDGVQEYSDSIGWDLAAPQTGFNVKAFNPAAAAANQDVYGQPLRHDANKIQGPPFALPQQIAINDKVRGMVLVHEYENGGASQLPCAQPIPLNDDGTPRKNTAKPPVLVYRYNPHNEMDFTQFNLRLL